VGARGGGGGVGGCLLGRYERRFGGKEVTVYFTLFVSVLTDQDVHVCVCVFNFSAFLMIRR